MLRRRFLGHIGQWSTGSKISKNGQRVMAKSIGFVIGPPSKHSFFRSTLQYLSLVIVLYYSPPSKTSLCGEKNKNQMIRDKASWNREIKSPSSDWPSWPQLKLDGTFVTINSKTCWQHLLFETTGQQLNNHTFDFKTCSKSRILLTDCKKVFADIAVYYPLFNSGVRFT